MSSSSLLLISLLFLLSPTALSQTCRKLEFKTPNKSFTSCANLPSLHATLHYTFNASSSTLSMAFTAVPSTYLGWVAWAINPNASGMAGSQTLLAYYNYSSHSVVASTFDVKSYRNLSRSPLSINVSDIAGESSDDKITVFGKWQLPNGTSVINQVWQVGLSVDKNGDPSSHPLFQSNLKSMSKLNLTAPAPAPGKNSAGEEMGRVGVWMGLVLGIVLLLV